MGEYNNFIETLNSELELYEYQYSFEKPKVTVIIPVYNAEDYIYGCLISIIKQTLKEIELIIVNDGSTDNTFSIISIFGQHDKRIKIINQKNAKTGAARNNALKLAKGEYISFVDSDDKLHKTALEELYKKANLNKSDVVICGAYSVKHNKKGKGYYSIEKIPHYLKNKVLKNNIIKKYIFSFPTTAWGKLYNTNFLIRNNILFQTGCNGEDQMFFIKTMLLADSIYIINKNYYYYLKDRKTSLTYSKQKNDNSVILNFYAIEKFLKKQNIDSNLNYKILNKYFIKAISWLGKCSNKYKTTYFNDLKKLQANLLKNYPTYYWGNLKIKEKDSYISIKIKIFISQIIFNRRQK